MKRYFESALVGGTVVALFLFAGGCTSDTPTTGRTDDEHTHTQDDDHAHAGEHMHGAWWCNEHGVPEEECTRCAPDLIGQYKGKGDWCDEHQRPDSQCFLCHPEYQAQFAARYEAKYGKQPPEPTDP